MECVDQYYIAPISVLTNIEYLGQKTFKIKSKVFKYACVSRLISDKYIDFLSGEIYHSYADYYHDIGRIFVNLNAKVQLIPLNQIIKQEKMTKRKFKKVVRTVLIEMNKQFLSEEELKAIDNIHNELKVKTKKLECGSYVLSYTENKN